MQYVTQGSDGPASRFPIIAMCWLTLACSSNASHSAGHGGNGNGGTASGGQTATAGTGGDKTNGGGSGGGNANGGASGATATGGASATGGGTGGPDASAPRAGGTTGGGGTTATGGATGSDASPGRDGRADGLTGGSTDSGGIGAGGTATGGSASTGGLRASGGAFGGSPGGATGSGGRTSSGGTIGTGGAGTGGTSSATSLCPPGITQTMTVAKDGSGQFSTVQAAVNSIPSGSSARIRIDIKAGTYTEKITIASRDNLCLVGADATTTVLSYGDSNASVGSTSGSASVYISANDFSAAHLTFANSYGSGSQAVALRTTGQRQQFLGCRFVGYQDTLYTHTGSQYIRDCYVQGNTDYVFGGATAVLQNCEVRNVEGGSATSAPNTDASTTYGIVFLGGKFTATSAIKASSVALARPWGADGFAAFLNADLGAHIAAAGFVAMSGNPPESARFHEYGSTGAGANTSSRSGYQLTASQAASYTLANIFGTWTPSYSQ